MDLGADVEDEARIQSTIVIPRNKRNLVDAANSWVRSLLIPLKTTSVRPEIFNHLTLPRAFEVAVTRR